MGSLQVAAVQTRARLGAWEENLETALGLAGEAFAAGAEWVILPEFFTTAVGFHTVMLGAVEPLEGRTLGALRELAGRYGGVVGGSFIAWRDGRPRNTFVLVFPGGSYLAHDKDQPTMWENCWYEGGSDDGVLTTPAGPVGAALCWELIRTRTVRRLRGRVDLVVGGSCWWTLPERRLPGFPPELHRRNVSIMEATPGRFARLVGAPVVHAAHAGKLEGRLPLVPGFPYASHFLGETQIVDASGEILARMRHEDGEGFVTAAVDPGRAVPSEEVPGGFWIPDLPVQFRLLWHLQNLHGRCYRRLRTHPWRRRHLSFCR